METLDLLEIEPRLKHSTFLKKFDALSAGQSFTICNNHDPIPMYYRLIVERGQSNDWRYLEKGPEKWEVKITKLKVKEKIPTIADIVVKDYRKAEVFRKFRLDFCCNGNISLKDACIRKKIDIDEIEEALAEIENQPKSSKQDFNDLELDFLVDYIVHTHHKYVKESLPIISELSDKIATVHGDIHAGVVEIGQLFNTVDEELKMHMYKEDNILFPYIKKLVVAKREKDKIEPSSFGSVINAIRMLEAEHVSAGENMDKIYKLSNEYIPPKDACTTHLVLFRKLEEFDQDLQQHIHLENNILFPKAIQLEKELFG